MARCLIDDNLERVTEGEFSFPLGVYPVEPLAPREGYAVVYEHADADPDDQPRYGPSYDPGYERDGSEDESWREDDDPGSDAQPSLDWDTWPDRYEFSVQVDARRLPALIDLAMSLMPGRVYPILDVIGLDAYREIDPYMSYELVGTERVVDGIREMRGYLFEDGMAGFGAISDEPFMYLFLDEHKLLTLAVEPGAKDRVVDMLAAFGLEELEELASVETVSHEHRTVLISPEDDPRALIFEQIVEYLRDQWRLRLNIDPMTNIDDAGRPLGVTAWRCIARCVSTDLPGVRYAECLLRAGSLNEAEDLTLDAVDQLCRAGPGALGSCAPQSPKGTENQPEGGEEPIASWTDAVIVSCDRLTPARLAEMVRDAARLHRRGEIPVLAGELGVGLNDAGDDAGTGARRGPGVGTPEDGSLSGVVLTRWEPLAP